MIEVTINPSTNIVEINKATVSVEILNSPIQIEIFGQQEGGTGGGGTITGATSIGGAIAVYKQLSGSTLEFKSLIGGTNITLTPGADTITIAAAQQNLTTTLSIGANAGGYTITNLGAPVNPSDAARLQDIPTAGAPTGTAGGDLTGTYPNPILVNTAVFAGTYGGSLSYPVISVDAKGRLISASELNLPTSLPPNGVAGGSLSGTYPNPSIALNVVTYDKIQTVTADRLLGRFGTAGDVQEIKLGAGIAYNAGTNELYVNEFDPLGWLTDGNAVPTVKSIGTTTPYDFPIIANGTELIRFKSNGAIKLGSTPPQDNASNTILVLNADNEFSYRDAGTIISGTGWMPSGNAFGSDSILGTIDNYNVLFYTNNLERARLTSTGRFGINMVPSNSMLGITLNDVAVKGIQVIGVDSQTSDYVEILNSASTSIFNINSAGLIQGIFSQNDALTRILATDSTGELYWRSSATLGGGGSAQTEDFNWKFDTLTTSVDPGTGKFKMDNVTPASVTNLYVDDLADITGLDISTIFTNLRGKFIIYIQQTDDASKFTQFSATAPFTDNTGWWTIPVTFIQAGAGGLFTHNTRCTWRFISESVTVPAGMLKGVAGILTTAVAGTDYSAGTYALATGILKSTNITGALTIAVAGDFPTLNQNTTGTAANVTGVVAIVNGGTGQITNTAAFNALSPVTTLGDLIVRDAANNIRLAGNTTTVKQYLSQTGTGTVSASPVWATIAGADITGAALTKVDDTNVLLTLGGTPTTALLRAASITVTWSGTLAATRGGTGTGTTAIGDLLQGATTNTWAKLASVSAGSYLRSGGVTTASTWSTVKLPDTMSALGIWVANALNTTVNLTAAASQSVRVNAGGTAWEAYTPASVTPAALTKVDDTNVTLTLGGTPTTALLQAASITVGWTGTLADGRIASAANWNTAYTNRITSLTVTGSSGAATLIANVLNVPTYTLAGLGGLSNPMTTLGDTIYGGVAGASTRLAGNITTTKQFLSQTGDAVNSAAPVWVAVTKTDVGLSVVENTALSTWAGTANITTLGTIATGTWQAGIIGSTYGGTGINNAGRTLTINTNSGTLAFAGAATVMTFPSTSATIARTDAANTFTGVQTMTSPSTTTSIVTASASFLAWNTIATTFSIAGAATTFTLGGTPTTALTATLFGNATGTFTKTLNIGTGGSATSVTNILLGSATAGATGTTTIHSTVFNLNETPAAAAITDKFLMRDSTGDVQELTLTGTPSVTTFLCGDGSWTVPPGAGSVTGSGTFRYIPRWGSTSTLDNSVLYQAVGGGIGLGTTSVDSSLNVLSIGTGANIAHLLGNDTTFGGGWDLWIGRTGTASTTASLGSNISLQNATSLKAILLQGSDDNFQIFTYAASTYTERLRLKSTGQLQLQNYTASGSFTGTPVGYLQFDASGNIITAAVPSGGGNVTKVGTPANNQIGVWTGDGTIEGDANLTWDATTLTITGSAPVKQMTRTNGTFTGAAINTVTIGSTIVNRKHDSGSENWYFTSTGPTPVGAIGVGYGTSNRINLAFLDETLTAGVTDSATGTRYHLAMNTGTDAMYLHRLAGVGSLATDNSVQTLVGIGMLDSVALSNATLTVRGGTLRSNILYVESSGAVERFRISNDGEHFITANTSYASATYPWSVNKGADKIIRLTATGNLAWQLRDGTGIIEGQVGFAADTDRIYMAWMDELSTIDVNNSTSDRMDISFSTTNSAMYVHKATGQGSPGTHYNEDLLKTKFGIGMSPSTALTNATFTVRGGTLVSNIMYLENSSGTVQASVSNAGVLTTVGNINSSGGKHQEAGVNISPIGKQDIWIPASAMWPTTTNGCAALAKHEQATTGVNLQYLEFLGDSTNRSAQFQIVMPRNWNLGTVTAVAYWYGTAGSGTVIFNISGIAFSHDDIMTSGTTTSQTCTTTFTVANDLQKSGRSAAITIGGTPAAEDFIIMTVQRDAVGDGNASPARLLGIMVEVSTNAATAA